MIFPTISLKIMLNEAPSKNLVELKPPIRDADSRARHGGEGTTPNHEEERKVPSHNLICVMTEKTSAKEQFPTEACDFVVFMDLTYNGQEDKLVPKTNGSGFELFSAMAANGTGNHLVAGQSGGHSRKFHESFKENRPRSLLLMFGIQVQNYKAPPADLLQNLQKIVKVVDYTILETHHSRPSTTCNALLPTSFREYSDLADNLPVVTALDWTNPASEGRGADAQPVLLAQLGFSALHAQDDHHQRGRALRQRRVHTLQQGAPASEPTGWAPSRMSGPSRLTTSANNEWQSFLTPDSITKMMRLALKVNPSVCVAAYYVDYEDYQGVCKVNQTFPRLTAVRHVLDQVRAR
ncbi:hypothetical protein MRX96_011541 [Rhipicephalus microplus]